uniref:Leucine zipper transcription factor-like protein 1 n=1 Tax=Sphenodon punctatus TaxID=8508 RepID=A0A8D0L2V9_SPHPU
RFARSKRGLRLKTVDSCFQDLKDSRYHKEGTILKPIPTLFSQAEKWYLKLQTDISELENRLQEENEKLKTRLKTIETQATSALDEKSKLEKALKDLQMIQGDQKLNTTQDISELEETVAALKCQFEKTLNDSTASQKSLEENLVTTKHDLLKVQDQLSMAEKELEKKFQQTAAYRNMKEILTRKNDQMKELRKRLSKYEPED